MIAEVKRQPRSNRRSPPLDNARDKPKISYLVFFPETGYTDIMLIIRDRQVFPNSSCPVGKVHFPFKNSGQSAKVSFTVQLQMKTGNA